MAEVLKGCKITGHCYDNNDSISKSDITITKLGRSGEGTDDNIKESIATSAQYNEGNEGDVLPELTKLINPPKKKASSKFYLSVIH